MSLHKEVELEIEICEHLAAHGWLYSPTDDGYDRARALFPDDVLAWVQATQPKAWEAIVKNHGANAADTLLNGLRDSLDQRGTLDVLRHGIEMLGLRGKLSLAQFKPALAMNPDILARYAANRLRVVRQLHYSPHNENSLDLGLFLNGLPMGTAELKTDFTQSIGDAIDQYRFDRHPKPKGQAAEPLLSFPSGALVHFAVSNREVHMTTRLNGTDTVFLPFNQGDDGAAGNPLNPNGGHRTAYLWEQVWERHSWLEILGRYLVAQKGDKKQIKTGHYDDFEVDRVVAVELKPNAKQSELAAAVEPVVDRLHKKYKAAQAALKVANDKKDKPAAETAQNELNACLLFQRDMGAFQRLYT